MAVGNAVAHCGAAVNWYIDDESTSHDFRPLVHPDLRASGENIDSAQVIAPGF
jgi:hypothetical protein